MTNYYEEYMPIITDEEEYLKYYIDESTPIFDKLNNIIKKGQPIQRQALLKNLIIYEKESLFKSLMNFIINAIPVWDIETILCFPKSLYEIITNVDYIIDNDLFNTIFKHMILSLSSGFEKARNEYLYYFNKIIEFYSVIDIKNNNQIKSNFFPYIIKEEIIELIIDLGIFGQTIQNRKLCCYLCSSICRIYYNSQKKEDTIKRLYQRLNYLFWDVEKTTEAQMARELLYIIPLFYEEMFKSEDIIQAIQSYINHDSDHVIQVMAIISLLKNIFYLNKKNENCGGVFNLLMNKIKEIIEDFDYESIYKNIILHILINMIYINHKELNTSFLYPVFQLEIMKNYYNFYKLDVLFIKNFDKYFFLINFFLENAPDLEKIYNENEKSNISTHKSLIEQIQTQINLEAYFIKIINELFFVEENHNKIKENTKKENNEEKNKDKKTNNEIANNNLDSLDNVVQINIINNNINKDKKNFDVENLIFDEYFLDENLDIIFNTKDENEKLEKYIYDTDIIKKILYLYLPRIIGCFPNIKCNKILSDKISFLFEIKNMELILDIYSKSMEYIFDKKILLKKHPLYKLLLLLLKKNLQIFKQKGKSVNKSANINHTTYEGNIYNKLFTNILSNIFSYLKGVNNDKKNKNLVLIGKILKKLIPKIYKYFKNITFTKVIDSNDINKNVNLSFSNYKDTLKFLYYEKVFYDIFNDIISKIIINNENLGHHVIKEYIEIIPILILYSKEKKKYYNFFIKEIFTADSFYMRKYTLLFYEQCFQIFSFNFLIKNNYFSDFCILFKDKVNLISTNAIELVLKNSKKIIAYSQEKYFDVCEILKEIYVIKTNALNNNINNINNINNSNNKNSEIIFDKDKNIVINKIMNINNNINKFYTEEEIIEEKVKESKLINNENNIYKLSNTNAKNNNKNNINLSKDENTKMNTFQSSKLISHPHKDSSIINNNINKNIISSLSLSQKTKNGKFFQIFDKPFKLVKERGRNLSNKCNNFLKSNLNKENKRTNIDLNGININLNAVHFNKRHNSLSKKLQNFNSVYNKHLLPKLGEQEIKLFEKDINMNNNINIKSMDFSPNKINLLSSDKKIKKNEQKYSFSQDNINNNNESNNRLSSAKMKIMKSYSLIKNRENLDMNPNLNIKNYDEIKNNNIINNNLRYSFNNESCNSLLNTGDKNLMDKEFNLTMKQNSKLIKFNKNSFISNKIYIDANK